MKVLMVCLGNICRSPLAEGILQKKAFNAGLKWQIESAGTNNYHTGEAPHHLSQKVAMLNGVDISHQRARKFSPDDFLMYDKIYALANDVLDEMRSISKNNSISQSDGFDLNKVDLLLNELYPGEDRDVPDPYFGTETGYHKVYALINDACDAIIEKYSPATNFKESSKQINE